MIRIILGCLLRNIIRITFSQNVKHLEKIKDITHTVAIY